MSRRAFAIIVALVLAVVAGGLWLLGRQSTLQWAVREAQARAHGALAIEQPTGSLLSRMHAARITWRGPSNAVQADDVDVSWSPLWLLVGTLAFDSVRAATLKVTTTASKHEPLKLPEKLRLPVRVRFDDGALGTLSLVNIDGDARTFEHVALSFATGPDRWSAKLASLRTSWGTISGNAQVATAAPFALDAALALVPEGRAADVPPISLKANAKGSLSAFDLAIDASAQTSKANAKLRIEPMSALPVTAIDATLHDVDVRHVFPSAPQAILAGNVKAARRDDGMLRGSVDIANHAAGTVDQRRLPIAHLAAELVAAPQRWWLEELVLDGGRAGKLTGTGWVSASEAGMVLVTDGIDLHNVHPALQTTHVAGNVYTSGAFDRQQMRFALTERRISFSGDAVYEPEKLTVNRIDVRAGSGRFAASGSLALDDEHAFAVKTRFASFDPSRFANIRSADLNGNLRATGQLAPVLHVRADGRLANSTVWGLPVAAEGNWASNKADQPTIGFDMRATIGDTRVAARGTVKDPKALKALDLALDLRGADLQQLYTITGVPFPSTPPYSVSGTLRFADNVWTLRGFDGQVGRSDLSGDFVVDVTGEKPFVRAQLTSRRMDMTDLGGFIGHDYHAPDPEPDKLLPHSPFGLEKLNAANVDLQLTGRSFRNERLPLHHLAAHLKLDHGKLTIDPLKFDAAGGAIGARVTMDARRRPIRTIADVDVHGIRLAKIAPAMKQSIATAGAIDGRARLAMSGNSFGAMLGSANGTLVLAMDRGTISDLVLRLADLDVAHAVTVMAQGDRKIPVRCVVADFAAEDGVFRPRTLVLDSEHTVIRGEGSVDVDTEQLALRLTAEPKDGSVFALRGPIRIDGTLKEPAVHPELGQAIARTAAAIALGVIAPPAAILPFLQPGKPQDVNCESLIERASQFIEAAKSEPRPTIAATAAPRRD